MRASWFKKWGWVYRPVSWPGTVVLLLALGFCVPVFIAIDRHSHSASDTLYGVFPYFTSSFLLFNWIASNSVTNEQ